MEVSTAECRRFAKECRDLAKSAKTVDEQEFLREREASWIKLTKQAERKKVKTETLGDVQVVARKPIAMPAR